MSPARRALLALALALGLGAGWSALRLGRPGDPPPPGGAFGPEHEAQARALLQRLVGGLLEFQEADGGFAPWAPADKPSRPEPEVKRAASSALAAWALVEAVRLGVALERGDLSAARDRALAYLRAQQAAPPRDGGLGRMPANDLGGERDPGPEVAALAAATAAWARGRGLEDALPLARAERQLGARVRAGLRDGWMRALVAMAIEARLSVGPSADLGPQARMLLPMTEASTRPDCGDYRVAEGIVRTLRGESARGDLYPEAVVQACVLEEPPVWSGKGSDLGSWFMQAWLATRSLEAAPWFARLLTPLEEALGSRGFVPEGSYADRVAQTACAALAVVQGLQSQVLHGQ